MSLQFQQSLISEIIEIITLNILLIDNFNTITVIKLYIH